MRTVFKYGENPLHGRHCPFLKGCEHMVTKHYFLHICDTSIYTRCQHYAIRARELNTPINWLQKLAVGEAKKAELRAINNITKSTQSRAHGVS